MSKSVWHSHSEEAGDRRGIRGEAQMRSLGQPEGVQSNIIKQFPTFCLIKFHESSVGVQTSLGNGGLEACEDGTLW